MKQCIGSYAMPDDGKTECSIGNDRINVDRQYIKHCPGLSYLLTCNF